MALDSSETGAVSGGITALTGAATGNPIALAAGVAGIAMSLFGGSQEAKAQAEEAKVSAEIAGYEQQINKQRQILATATYNRQSTENFRKAQMAAHTARAAATNQGAQFSSGAISGEKQAYQKAAVNQQDLAENYQIGQNIFGLTDQIDAAQIRLAQLGGTAAEGAGLASMGQGLTSGAMALGRLTGGFGAKG
jgi:hypothetical protein